MMRRLGWLAAIAFACALVVARPHVVDCYGLYLGSASAPQDAVLYLDPFPDVISCESRAHLFRNNGERAFCADRRSVAFGSNADAALAVEFARIFPGGRDCAPRKARPSRT